MWKKLSAFWSVNLLLQAVQTKALLKQANEIISRDMQTSQSLGHFCWRNEVCVCALAPRLTWLGCLWTLGCVASLGHRGWILLWDWDSLGRLVSLFHRSQGPIELAEGLRWSTQGSTGLMGKTCLLVRKGVTPEKEQAVCTHLFRVTLNMRRIRDSAVLSPAQTSPWKSRIPQTLWTHHICVEGSCVSRLSQSRKITVCHCKNVSPFNFINCLIILLAPSRNSLLFTFKLVFTDCTKITSWHFLMRLK